MAELSDAAAAEIDAALAAARQGDALLGDALAFVHLFVAKAPITPAAQEAAAEVAAADAADPAVTFSASPGFVILSQTCDIVRPCRKRPFIELAPLTEVTEQALKEIRLLMRPQYAFMPALADRRLVADLDRTMTVEKAVVATLPRTPSITTDAEAAALAQALARKRARFAFPDPFNASLGQLQNRLTRRAGKNSDEGTHVDALAEIRVAAAPSWDAPAVSVTYWFIKAGDPPRPNWSHWATEWAKLIDQSGAYTIDGAINIVRLEDMKASEYVQSHRLDLDQLTRG